MILCGGENVFPQEVEDLLLADEAVPREIALVDQLPSNSTGKLQRRKLAELSFIQPVGAGPAGAGA